MRKKILKLFGYTKDTDYNYILNEYQRLRRHAERLNEFLYPKGMWRGYVNMKGILGPASRLAHYLHNTKEMKLLNRK